MLQAQSLSLSGSWGQQVHTLSLRLLRGFLGNEGKYYMKQIEACRGNTRECQRLWGFGCIGSGMFPFKAAWFIERCESLEESLHVWRGRWRADSVCTDRRVQMKGRARVGRNKWPTDAEGRRDAETLSHSQPQLLFFFFLRCRRRTYQRLKNFTPHKCSRDTFQMCIEKVSRGGKPNAT